MVKNEKMIGVWLTENLVDKLDLMSIKLGVNRSKYIRELLAQIMESETIEGLLNSIVQNCIIEWKEIEKNVRFTAYTMRVRQALEKKKINENYITYIITKLKEWKEKEER